MQGASSMPALQVRSAVELKQAVRQASGVLRIDASRLDRVLRLDAMKGMVEVQASASWAALAAYLRPSAPHIAQAWDAPANDAGLIGASVNANHAGPDGRTTISHVEALALVTPDGELRRITREANGNLFALVVGGQGLFGALYSVTLRLESLAQAALGKRAATVLGCTQAGKRLRRLRVLVPPERRARFVEEACERCAEWRIAMQALEARAVLPEAESYLSWARTEYEELTLALEEPPALGGCVRSTQLQREIIDLAIGHGGSFPIARSAEATRAQVEKCYPVLKRFLAEKRRYDPAERLVNDWYRHHRSLLGREAWEAGAA